MGSIILHLKKSTNQGFEATNLGKNIWSKPNLVRRCGGLDKYTNIDMRKVNVKLAIHQNDELPLLAINTMPFTEE